MSPAESRKGRTLPRPIKEPRENNFDERDWETQNWYNVKKIISEFMEKLKIAHNKINNVIKEQDLSQYLIKLIIEYEEKIK